MNEWSGSCSSCSARPGEPCLTPSGRVKSTPHGARVPSGPDRATRDEVRERDRRCRGRDLVPEVRCRGALQVHHINRRRKDNDPANLVLLCAAHHGWVHDNIEAARGLDLLRPSGR